MGSLGNSAARVVGRAHENAFGTPDVAEPRHVFIPNYFAHELLAAFAEPDERMVDVLHGEHDA